MKGYSFNVNKNLASVSFINDTNERRDMLDRKWSHYPILNKLLNYMGSRGFEVGRDPEIQKKYKCLNRDHWYGHKGNLEFKAQRYPHGFKIEFFQNVIFKNPCGGFYDFDKFDKMPYLIKLMWINETNKISDFLEGLSINTVTKSDYILAEDKIKSDYAESWHHPQKDMNFNLSDLDGTTDKYKYNKTDRDNKIIRNGQIKYFRGWNGRLMRGKVYHNINNMWWIILNDTQYTNIADFYLFDPTPKDFKVRRAVEDKKPKEYLEKIENIKKLSNKELLRELRKRGVKVT